MAPMRLMVGWLWRYRGRILAGLAVLLVIDAAQMIVPWLVGRAVDDLAHGRSDACGRQAAAIVTIGLVLAVMRFFWRYLLIGAARRIRRDLRSKLYERLLTLEPAYFDRKPTGELMALATNDLDAVAMACGFGVLALFDALFLVTFTLCAMSLIAPELMWRALIPMPLLAVFVVIAGRLIHSRFERVQERFGSLTERVREAVAGVRVVKGFGREDDFDADFRLGSRAYQGENLRLIAVSSGNDPVIGTLSGIAAAIVLWSGGSMAISGEISLGDFVAFTGFLGMLTWPMMAVGWVINLVQRGSVSMRRIQEVLDRIPAIADSPNSVAFPEQPSLSCRSLTFSYPGAVRPALDGCAFELAAGATLGVIGLTGSGKSTLAAMFLRMLDPPPGTLSLGGHDLLSIRLSELRRGTALVPQEPFLFAMTIAENIAFARPDATRTDIEAAARLSCIHDEITRFADGYDTIIGERGVTLSGGQRQRVAIARALLADPRLLVLDDCLSAVDAATEAAVIANLRGFLTGRTAVVVSHRIAAVRQADLVLVLDHGTIAERGRHEQLIAGGGLYARIATLQRAEEDLDRAST